MILHTLVAAAAIAQQGFVLNPGIKTTDGDVVIEVTEGHGLGVKTGDGDVKYVASSEEVQGIERVLGISARDVGDEEAQAGGLVGGIADQNTIMENQNTIMETIAGHLSTQNVLLTISAQAAQSVTSITESNWMATSTTSAEGPGGDVLAVVGRNFMPNFASLYTCVWTKPAEGTDAPLVVRSAPVAAENTTHILCTVPAWTEYHTVEQLNWATMFSLDEAGRTVTPGATQEFVWSSAGPISTLPDSVNLNLADFSGGVYAINYAVGDPDGDVSEVTVTLAVETMTPGNCGTISAEGTGAERSLLVSASDDCDMTVHVTGTDTHGAATVWTLGITIKSRIELEYTNQFGMRARQYSDGSRAARCRDYRHPADGLHFYEGRTGSGLYLLSRPGTNTPHVAFCDMETNAGGHNGGWTALAVNGNLGSKGCGYCINCRDNRNNGCASVANYPGVGDIGRGPEDYTMDRNFQTNIQWRSLIHMTFSGTDGNGMPNYSAGFGIQWGNDAPSPNDRNSGSPFDIPGQSRISCSCGRMIGYYQYTVCNNPSQDRDTTKFYGSTGKHCTMSYHDHHGYDEQRGFDDYQDGCGCGDSWSPKRVKGHRSMTLVW